MPKMNLAKKQILWFASVFVSLMIVDCWIIRKACVQEADFSIIHAGRALENNVIATFNSLSIAQCKKNCVDDWRCKSINHADDDSSCELNDRIGELAHPGDFKSKSGWSYHSTNYAVKNIGPICRDQKPCSLTQYCMDTCYCPGYQCVALPNIALGRPAEQVGIHSFGGVNFYAYLGNDGLGNDLGSYGLDSCAITNKDGNSYWLVDLGGPYLVQSVAVLSSKDFEPTKINPFEIRVGNDKEDGGKYNPLCAGNLNVKAGEKLNCICGPKFGRYVSVNKNYKEYASYCEVEVYGMVV